MTLIGNAARLEAVMRRHEVLRTTFLNQHGRPVQHVADPMPITLPTIDLEPEELADLLHGLLDEC